MRRTPLRKSRGGGSEAGEEDVRGACTQTHTRAELHSGYQKPSICVQNLHNLALDTHEVQLQTGRHLPALILRECDGPIAVRPLHNICIPTAGIRTSQTQERFEWAFEFVKRDDFCLSRT